MSSKENKKLKNHLRVDEKGLFTSDSESRKRSGKKQVRKAFHWWRPADLV